MESVKRSQRTILPAASAGSITSAIAWARSANISAISVSGASPVGARVQHQRPDAVSCRRSAGLPRYRNWAAPARLVYLARVFQATPPSA